MLRLFIGFIGFVFLYGKLKSILLYCFNLFFGPKRNLTAIYGKDSYVVVTGGSEGIGEAIAHEFAARGFNLILIARSTEKLQKAKETVAAKYPKCKVIIVSFDFCDIDKPENFDLEKAFKLKLSDLDISVVVNNVGIGRNSLFYDSDEESIKRMLKVNIVSEVLMTRYFIPLFNKRKSRSAFWNVSSQSAINAIPLYDTYGASKLFNKQFSESIGCFYDKIDVYTFIPGFVTTRLTNFSTKGKTVVTPEESAKGAMNSFGSYRHSFYGHWKHEVMGLVLNILPEWLLAKFIMANRAKYTKKANDQ
jgi:short-subunit dehydrogenase